MKNTTVKELIKMLKGMNQEADERIDAINKHIEKLKKRLEQKTTTT